MWSLYNATLAALILNGEGRMVEMPVPLRKLYEYDVGGRELGEWGRQHVAMAERGDEGDDGD